MSRWERRLSTGRRKPKVHPLVRRRLKKSQGAWDGPSFRQRTLWRRGALFKNLLQELCWDGHGVGVAILKALLGASGSAEFHHHVEGAGT